MATTTTNAMQAQIKERGFMTEREMLTLKSRSNKAQKDLLDYDTINPDGYGTKITPEWGAKGLQWLKGLLTTKGEPRKGQNLGYREIEIIKTASPEDFTFIGFYDAGRGWCHNYLPVYNCGGMEYYISNGFIQVVG